MLTLCYRKMATRGSALLTSRVYHRLGICKLFCILPEFPNGASLSRSFDCDPQRPFVSEIRLAISIQLLGGAR